MIKLSSSNTLLSIEMEHLSSAMEQQQIPEQQIQWRRETSRALQQKIQFYMSTKLL
jgi:hypothetical protein